jgi:large exoprotein involved in heme utilization and adhesion
VRIDAADRLFMSGVSDQGTHSGIITENRSRGQAGDVTIMAGDVSMLGGAYILGQAGTYGGRNGGDAADVRIQATGDILISGYARGGDGPSSSGIYALSFAGGAGGSVDISGRSLTLYDGAAIFASAVGGGDAGQVRIRTSGDVTVETVNSRGSDISVISVESYGAGNGGVIDIEAQNFYLLGGSEIILRATESEGGSAGQLTITARDSIIQRSDTKFSSVFAEGLGEGASSADITYNARVIEIDRGQITINTIDTSGTAGSISLNASERILLTGESSVGSAAVNTTQLGSDIFVNTGLLEVTDESSLQSNTFGISLGAGSIYIQADEMRIDGGSIDAEACSCSTGSAGSIFIDVAGALSLTGTTVGGEAAGIRSRTFGAGPGGTINVSANSIFIGAGAAILASSEATSQDFIDQGLPGNEPGSAGSILISADSLEMAGGGSIASAAVEAAGGNIELDIADLIYLTDASITAEALGVTPADDGGNVVIARPTAIVLHQSAIRANANAGNGGNIGIAAEVLVPSADSVIDASSKTGIDGQVVIDSPNQAVSSVALLDAPVFDVSELVQDPCEVDVGAQRSSLTIEGQGGLPERPDEFQSSPKSRHGQRDAASLPAAADGPDRQASQASAGACAGTGP